MTECSKCRATIEAGEEYEHLGNTVCEDCYLDAMNPPKTCDPWAVHLAKSCATEEGHQLSPMQEKILNLLKEKGPLKAEEVIGQLKISESDFKSSFATLRHMELARGFKKGQEVYYTLFSS